MHTTRLERSQKFALMISKARADAKFTQKQMAQALGKSLGTIQNWESGLSSPSYLETEEWFQVLGLNMCYYILNYKYPDIYGKISHNSDIKDIELAIHEFIHMRPDSYKRQLAFNLFGNTGSDHIQQLNMLTAHNHTSMRSRCNVAQLIIDNYRMEEARGELVCTSNVMPNINSLEEATKAGKESVYIGKNGYNI